MENENNEMINIEDYTVKNKKNEFLSLYQNNNQYNKNIKYLNKDNDPQDSATPDNFNIQNEIESFNESQF
jgi:hypothetical protein